MDVVAIAQFVALKNDAEGAEGARYKKKMEAEKGAYLSALANKCTYASLCIPIPHHIVIHTIVFFLFF